MAAMASTSFSMLAWRRDNGDRLRRGNPFSVSAQQPEVQEDVKETEPEGEVQEDVKETEPEGVDDSIKQKQDTSSSTMKPLRPVEPQLNVKSKNMAREYGGQWLSCTTRHVRIFAAIRSIADG